MKNFLHIILTATTAFFSIQFVSGEASIWAPIGSAAAYAAFLIVLLKSPKGINFRLMFSVGGIETLGVITLVIVNWKAGLLYLALLLSAALVMSVAAALDKEAWENYNTEAFHGLTNG
jgi:hypothetical protein